MSHTDTDRRLKPDVNVRVKHDNVEGVIVYKGRNRDGVYYSVKLTTGEVRKYNATWLEPKE